MTQAFSMLAMRRKTLSVSATASLTSRLVDLALVSPTGLFNDIISLFSTLSRESLTVENKQLTTAVSIIANDEMGEKFNPSYGLDHQCSFEPCQTTFGQTRVLPNLPQQSVGALCRQG